MEHNLPHIPSIKPGIKALLITLPAWVGLGVNCCQKSIPDTKEEQRIEKLGLGVVWQIVQTHNGERPIRAVTFDFSIPGTYCIDFLSERGNSVFQTQQYSIREPEERTALLDIGTSSFPIHVSYSDRQGAITTAVLSLSK